MIPVPVWGVGLQEVNTSILPVNGVDYIRISPGLLRVLLLLQRILTCEKE